MEVGDWITLAAVIVALGIGVAAILQTQSLQKKERKERLLNEIIEWAIDVTNLRSGGKGIFKEIAGIADIKEVEILTQAHIIEMKESYVGMRGRNKYVSSIIRDFKQDLQQAVIKLIEDLEVYIEVLDEWWKFKCDAIEQDSIKTEEYITKDGEYTTKADEYMLQIDNSANEVIEEAAKVKTRDIS